jgi:hypothetical protein
VSINILLFDIFSTLPYRWYSSISSTSPLYYFSTRSFLSLSQAFAQLRGSATSSNTNKGTRQLQQIGQTCNPAATNDPCNAVNSIQGASFALNPLAVIPVINAPVAAPAEATPPPPSPAGSATATTSFGDETVTNKGSSGESTAAEAGGGMEKDAASAEGKNSNGSGKGTAFGDSIVVMPREAAPEPAAKNMFGTQAAKPEVSTDFLQLFGKKRVDDGSAALLAAGTPGFKGVNNPGMGVSAEPANPSAAAASRTPLQKLFGGNRQLQVNSADAANFAFSQAFALNPLAIVPSIAAPPAAPAPAPPVVVPAQNANGSFAFVTNDDKTQTNVGAIGESTAADAASDSATGSGKGKTSNTAFGESILGDPFGTKPKTPVCTHPFGCPVEDQTSDADLTQFFGGGAQPAAAPAPGPFGVPAAAPAPGIFSGVPAPLSFNPANPAPAPTEPTLQSLFGGGN